MTITPLNPFAGPIGPITTITPFTHRDNATYLSILRGLVKQFDSNVEATNKNFTDLITSFNKEIGDALTEWLTKFNDFMDDVVAQLEGLNDEAVANLLGDPLTQTGAKFLELTDEFARIVEPNILYVNPVTGNDSNEGSAVAPFKTVAQAFTLIERHAQKANTEWIVNLSAGSFTERVRPSAFTPFGYKVTIQGPAVGHPGTPLTLFTEGAGAQAVAMFFSNPLASVTVKDIAFSGYNGTVSSCGINSVKGEIFTVNVHAEYCYFGVSSSDQGKLDMKGGILEWNGRLNGDSTGNGAAVRSLFQNHHSIGRQNAGTQDEGPFFRNNATGVSAQESSTGHCDWCLFEDNTNGIMLNVNSRSNADGSAFYRNSNGINARGNSNVNISSNTIFGTGADRNAQNTVITTGSQAPTIKATDVDMSYARGEQAFWGNYNQAVFTGSTAVLDVFSRVLDGNWWNDTVQVGGTAPKRVRLRAYGNVAGTNGTKQFAFRLGTLVTSQTITAPETGDFMYEAIIFFASPTRQIVSSKIEMHLGDTQRVDNATGSIDMSVDTNVRLTIGNSDATDTVTFETVELLFG